MTAVLAPANVPACKGRENLFDAAVDALERMRPGQPEPAVVHDARDICSACPAELKAGCLSVALSNRERFGVWAGTTPDDRAAMEAASWLQEPPTTDRHDRSTYNAGCRCAECTEANRVYIASRPRVTERGAIAVPHKPNDRRRRCEGQSEIGGEW